MLTVDLSSKSLFLIYLLISFALVNDVKRKRAINDKNIFFNYNSSGLPILPNIALAAAIYGLDKYILESM